MKEYYSKCDDGSGWYFDALVTDADYELSQKYHSTDDIPDDVYNEICERIYASGLLATEPDHVTLITNLINEMNGVIDCYRTTRNQMVGQRKAQSAQTPEQEPEVLLVIVQTLQMIIKAMVEILIQV